MRAHVYTVSEILGLVRGLLEDEFPEVWVEGELTGFRSYPSGHWYFSLKDATGVLGGVMWRGDNQRVRFHPEDGLRVLVRGTLTLYEPRGQFQIRVLEMEPRGAGALALAFEQIRRKLDAEGLFAPERKRPLPLLPRRIGVVTSKEGAAIRDILRVLGRRDERVSVLLSPCPVQGAESAPGILLALRSLAGVARQGGIDVAIVARGGGSPEDLWGFNDEAVARAIAAFPVPVVTGIGHEIDTTIADFAADVRAATPSQAAELVVRQRHELREQVVGLGKALVSEMRLRLQRVEGVTAPFATGRVGRLLHARIGMGRERSDDLLSRLLRGVRARIRGRGDVLRNSAGRLSPRLLLQGVRARRESVRVTEQRFARAALGRVSAVRGRVVALAGRLDALSPLAVLERGYAVVRREDDRRILRDAAQVGPGAGIEVRLHRGRLLASVRATVKE